MNYSNRNDEANLMSEIRSAPTRNYSNKRIFKRIFSQNLP